MSPRFTPLRCSCTAWCSSYPNCWGAQPDPGDSEELRELERLDRRGCAIAAAFIFFGLALVIAAVLIARGPW